MLFRSRVTGALKSYAPGAKKIHIDIDPSELHKNVRADVAIAGDLADVLRAWLPLVTACSRDEWLERIAELAGGEAVRDIEDLPDTRRLLAAHVIHDIWRATGGQAIIATDAGIGLELQLAPQSRDAVQHLVELIASRGIDPAKCDIRFGMDPLSACAVAGSRCRPLAWGLAVARAKASPRRQGPCCWMAHGCCAICCATRLDAEVAASCCT